MEYVLTFAWGVVIGGFIIWFCMAKKIVELEEMVKDMECYIDYLKCGECRADEEE